MSVLARYYTPLTRTLDIKQGECNIPSSTVPHQCEVRARISYDNSYKVINNRN